MEPYDLKLHQVTFKEENLQDDNLDSFSNVISYDSALLDSSTGKKPNTDQVSESIHFACSHISSFAQSTSQQYLPTPFYSNVVSSPAHTEPQADICRPPQSDISLTHFPQEKSVDQRIPSGSDDDYEGTINKLIKDLYSDVEIPFKPLTKKTSIPDWIFLHKTSEQDLSAQKHQQHIFAQPSKVKVTHVYNQSVWSEIPSTPAQVTHLLARSDSQELPKSVKADFDIKTLLQISANTSASKKYERGKHIHLFGRMAHSHPQQEYNKPDKDETFESVADALHLQQSVISNPHISPAAPDVVAKIVEEAERKLKMGLTPASSLTPMPTTHHVTSGSSQSEPVTNQSVTPLNLPPPPKLPNMEVTKELIRQTTHGFLPQTESIKPGLSAMSSFISSQDIAHHASGSFSSAPRSPAGTLSSLQDDTQSVASTNSEVEALTENVTETFLKSLPPFKPIKLDDIMPLQQQKPDLRFSPPVKETSFRPVNFSEQRTPTENMSGLQSFVTDSGVFSPDEPFITSPEMTPLPSVNKPAMVIPKPGPLFQVRPSLVKERTPVIKSDSLTREISTDSAHNNEKVDEILREKAKLEGQLEMLTFESQATLQERAELQAQVASLKLKLLNQKVNRNDPEKDMMKVDLEGLRSLRHSLEFSVGDLQKQLEEKSEESRNIQEELSQSQDACDKLNLKMKEIKDDLKSKEMTIQALKNKVAELYVDVQVSMQTKMEADNECRAAKSDVTSLKSTKDWYQEQLELATKARSELQREMTVLQAQAVSQSSIIERLKNENTKLRHQFSEIQNKALKEKEMLAKHLEAINSDMMDREAAFQEIQRERSYLEKTFDSKIQTAEDEKNRISLLMQMTSDLENQLDRAHADLKKKQNQITKLENENIELMKKLSLSQEVVTEKEGVIEDLKNNLLDVEERLKAFQNSVINKDSEIMKLKEGKAAAEIALKSALQEKESVDQVLDGLKSDMGKVESSFKLMRHELTSKTQEVGDIKAMNQTSGDEVVQLRKDLDSERRLIEHTKLELENKAQQLNEVQNQKIKLESDVVIYKEKITAMENAHETALNEKEFLDSELNATRDKLEVLKDKLESQIQAEHVQKADAIDQEVVSRVNQECANLQQKMVQLEKDGKKDVLKQKARNAKLNQDLNSVKDELMERQKMFDQNLEVLSGKLREVAADREKLETELTMVHRKYEFSMLEQKDQIDTELQKLATELQNVRFEKQDVETKFVELQHARDSDLNLYQQQLATVELELQKAVEIQNEKAAVTENNQQLLIELEKEKGRLEGLKQSNATLKEHVVQLEDALAGRESILVEMRSNLEQVLREKEAESHASIKRVQTIEEALQKEKDGQRDIKKQIGQKITENKKLRRQNESLKADQEQLKSDLEQKVREVAVLNAELETQEQNRLSQQSLSQNVESENKSLQRELESLQQKLQDNAAREPVIQEHMKSLEWQIKSKTAELEAAQHQIELAEQRQQSEIDNIKQVLKEKNLEIESLKGEVVLMKHDKQTQQSRLVELRSALKTAVQHHKMTKKITALGGMANSGDTELPPLPFDLEDMERLLQDTTVKALESKPLDNLQNCLLNLRSEIAGLQQQMDVHANTVETSTETWNSLEDQVQQIRHVVQTISNTTMSTATTTSLAAAAVDILDKSGDIIDI